jgi:hypothetical protein
MAKRTSSKHGDPAAKQIVKVVSSALIQIKKGLWMRFARPPGPDQLSSFDSNVFGRQRRKKAAP